MADDLLEMLSRFHREVMLPDVERSVGALGEQMVSRLDDVNAHFDETYRRFDRLESEFQALAASMNRLDGG